MTREGLHPGLAALLAAALLLPATAAAETIIVDYDGVGSIYTRIQDGIDAASDGDEVWVVSFISMSPVTFSGPGNTNLDLSGKNITIVATEGPVQTIIDCGGTDRAFIVGAGVDSTSRISGFTIQNGSAADTGGAILCDGGSPRIEDCVFRGNSAPVGAAVKFSGGTTRVTGCAFYANTAADRGGAICADDTQLTVSRCTFSDNEAHRGGGVALESSSLTAFRNTFANNLGAFGSSIFVDSSTASVEQCVLAFGRASSPISGGAPETFHSCIYGNASGDALPGNAHDNINEDPLLCDLYAPSGGNMALCSNSPCLQSGNVWTLPIGSKAQGCGDCDSPVRDTTWGSIKALYR